MVYKGSHNVRFVPYSFSIRNTCSHSYVQFSPPDGCFPQNIVVTKKDTPSDTIFKGVATSTTYFPTGGLEFEYDVDYIIKALNDNNETLYSFTTRINSVSYSAIARLKSSSTVTPTCAEDHGMITIINGSGLSTSLPGYSWSMQRWVHDSTSIKIISNNPLSDYYGETYYKKDFGNGSEIFLPQVHLPAGNYTIEINDRCNPVVQIPVYYDGGYDASAFDIDTVGTCGGLKVTPKGKLKLAGSEVTTYYRIIEGPAGEYDANKVISSDDAASNNFFTFSSTGTYKIGISYENSSTGCILKETAEIKYTAPPGLQLNTYTTAAYVCNGQTIGHILISAIYGSKPYTYQLWDINKTTMIMAAPNDITNGIAHFEYGSINTEYSVKVIDSCNNDFWQDITMTDLSTARIVYTPNNGDVCSGGTIQLNCITLGTTNYTWTGPNGWSSTSQNPAISNANKATMQGWYKIVVQPEFCGDEMRDSVYITILDYHRFYLTD